MHIAKMSTVDSRLYTYIYIDNCFVADERSSLPYYNMLTYQFLISFHYYSVNCLIRNTLNIIVDFKIFLEFNEN